MASSKKSLGAFGSLLVPFAVPIPPCDFDFSPSVTHVVVVGLITVVSRPCYLVDPASSHMLVSKIKPCMCKYELFQTVKLRMAH